MQTSDILKRNLPEYQQGNKILDGYLEGAGDFFDGTKEAIEQLDYSRNHKKSTYYQLERSLEDRGIDLPAKINDTIKRRILRDVAEIFKKNGTTDALVHALRTVGIQPIIENGWLFDPRQVRTGWRRDPLTDKVDRRESTSIDYADLLFGTEIVTPSGVFFEGYQYIDFLKENKIGPLPIIGERYPDTPENIRPVEKTPYVLVRLDGSDWIIPDQGPTVDDDTGDIAEFTPTERYELVTEILRFFVFNVMRPTPLRMLLVVDTIYIEDEVQIFDEVGDLSYSTEDVDEVIAIEEDFIKSSHVSIGTVVIGPHNIIGFQTPHLSHVSPVEPLNIGSTNNAHITEELSEWYRDEARLLIRANKPVYFIPIRGVTDVEFEAHQSCTIVLYKNKADMVGVIHGSYSVGESVKTTLPLGYDMFKIIPISGNRFSTDITPRLVYRANNN